jgi:hypothetical protein
LYLSVALANLELFQTAPVFAARLNPREITHPKREATAMTEPPTMMALAGAVGRGVRSFPSKQQDTIGEYDGRKN